MFCWNVLSSWECSPQLSLSDKLDPPGSEQLARPWRRRQGGHRSLRFDLNISELGEWGAWDKSSEEQKMCHESRLKIWRPLRRDTFFLHFDLCVDVDVDLGWLQEYDVSMLLLGARLTPVWNLDWTSFFGFGSNNRNLLWQLSLIVVLMKISSEVNYCLWILQGPWDYIMNSLWLRFCSGSQTILLRVSNYRGFWTRVATTKSWCGAPPKVRSVWSHKNTTKSKSRQNCNWY